MIPAIFRALGIGIHTPGKHSRGGKEMGGPWQSKQVAKRRVKAQMARASRKRNRR